jgi:Protein of unknown function (DUF4238)
MAKQLHGHSAVRQHFLPQFLLRGFSVRRGKKDHYTHEFRSNGVVRRGEVRTVGYQRRFYGSDALEGKLADRETRYANLLQTLRVDSIDIMVKSQIDELVSHLLVRTNNFRSGLVQMGRAMADGIKEQFDRAEPGSRIDNMIQEATHSLETQETIEREARKLPEAVRPIYRQTIQDWMNSPLFAENLRTIASQAVPMIDIPMSVRNAQVQVLEEEARVQKRAKSLQRFTWQILEYKPNTLVLGDHGPLGQEIGQTSMRSLMMMEGISMVYLPVSHQRLLIGTHEGVTAYPDPEYLNVNSVELSHELFVARTDSARERGYLSLIGKRRMLFDPQELRELIEEGLKPAKDLTPGNPET